MMLSSGKNSNAFLCSALTDRDDSIAAMDSTPAYFARVLSLCAGARLPLISSAVLRGYLCLTVDGRHGLCQASRQALHHHVDAMDREHRVDFFNAIAKIAGSHKRERVAICAIEVLAWAFDSKLLTSEVVSDDE